MVGEAGEVDGELDEVDGVFVFMVPFYLEGYSDRFARAGPLGTGWLMAPDRSGSPAPHGPLDRRLRQGSHDAGGAGRRAGLLQPIECSD